LCDFFPHCHSTHEKKKELQEISLPEYDEGTDGPAKAFCHCVIFSPGSSPSFVFDMLGD
jgi:hypothetical protein